MDYKKFITPDEIDAEVPNEYLWERIRNWRNAQMILSDWTQIADSICDKTAWATYRQVLRDLPASTADPRKVQLPTAPISTN